MVGPLLLLLLLLLLLPSFLLPPLTAKEDKARVKVGLPPLPAIAAALEEEEEES